MLRHRSVRLLFASFVLIGASVVVVGSADPVGARTESFAGCDVTAPKPIIARPDTGGDFMRATGAVTCNERKNLTIVVKLMWQRLSYPWEVVDTASKTEKGVFGLYASVSDACPHRTLAHWKDVVIVTINGDKKPAVESEITDC